MHEILAPVLWAVERDAVDPDTVTSDSKGPKIVEDICSLQYVAHDTFTIFAAIMQNLKWAYAPPASAKSQASEKQDDITSLSEPPIVKRSRRILDRDLSKVDPALCAHLQRLEIAPQIFLM